VNVVQFVRPHSKNHLEIEPPLQGICEKDISPFSMIHTNFNSRLEDGFRFSDQWSSQMWLLAVNEILCTRDHTRAKFDPK
jgi:hypothetical protein